MIADLEMQTTNGKSLIMDWRTDHGKNVKMGWNR